MCFLSLRVGVAGNDFDRVNDSLKLGIVHLARSHLAVDGNRAFLLVHFDACWGLLIGRTGDKSDAQHERCRSPYSPEPEHAASSKGP